MGCGERQFETRRLAAHPTKIGVLTVAVDHHVQRLTGEPTPSVARRSVMYGLLAAGAYGVLGAPPAEADTPAEGGYVTRSEAAVNVVDYGAVGDGSTVDTAAFVAALTATPAGGVLALAPGRTYVIDDTFTIDTPVVLEGRHATIKSSKESAAALHVTSSNVAIRDLVVTGPRPGADATVFGEDCLLVEGVSTASRISGISIERCDFSGFGAYGIRCKFADDVVIDDCAVHDIAFGGIFTSSVDYAKITRNRVTNITQANYASGANPGISYGIQISRNGVTDLTAYPPSRHVLVAFNTVRDIPHWSVIGSHSGQHITYLANEVYNAQRGIGCIATAIAGSDYGAPQHVQFLFNRINSDVPDGSYKTGITISGERKKKPDPTDPSKTIVVAGEYAVGISAIGNVIAGYGSDSAAAKTGGVATIRASTTQGLIIRDNQIIDPAVVGIALMDDNQYYDVTGNTITDVWSTSQTTNGVRSNGTGNSGRVGVHGCTRGDASPHADVSHRMEYAISIATDDPSVVTELDTVSGPWTLTPNIYDTTASTHKVDQSRRLLFFADHDDPSAAVGRQSLTGAKPAGADPRVDSLVAALAHLGLAADHTT